MDQSCSHERSCLAWTTHVNPSFASSFDWPKDPSKHNVWSSCPHLTPVSCDDILSAMQVLSHFSNSLSSFPSLTWVAPQMTKPSLLLSLCLLITTAYYLSSPSSSLADSSVLHDTGRRATMTKDLNMPFVNRKLKSHNIKVHYCFTNQLADWV